MAKLAFDDAEGMLELGPDHRDDAVDPLVEGMAVAMNWLARQGRDQFWPVRRAGGCGFGLWLGDAGVFADGTGHVLTITQLIPRRLARSPRTPQQGLLNRTVASTAGGIRQGQGNTQGSTRRTGEKEKCGCLTRQEITDRQQSI